ncbi:MAG: hypothetical protein M2R45_02951 [Verrucomicrobia subdivision 3 bacterium]|nr:hypothetical protein [Limisphaerales bacterium]MCS1415329.1 hypothetical protein [Limisphaerales bacterium]
MNQLSPICDRRNFLGQSALGFTLFTTLGLFAEHLVQTPDTAEGPLSPDKMLLNTDNDLLIVNDSIMPAVDEVTYLHSHVFSTSDALIRNAFVEIWQVDGTASYCTPTDAIPRDTTPISKAMTVS